jgi:hypothetical protein
MHTSVRAINDVYNQSGSPSRSRAADPRFQRVATLLRLIQQEGGLGVRSERRRDGESTVIFFRSDAGGKLGEAIAELRGLLGIRTDARDLRLAFGSLRHDDNEVTLLTRSMMEMLVELSAGVDVPASHVAEGRARVIGPPGGMPDAPAPLVHIRSSVDEPPDAYVAVRYRNHWFWIDDRDLASKRTFTFLRIFSSIAETGTVPQIPILTIPAN